ncbi:MAG TPA: hypothetical protein VJ803_02915 [Gemmatimonadaceae bacterium]|nr:hypothetical protein [Gemmatimonadaceae bacterium]
MTVRTNWATTLLLPLVAIAVACGEPTAPGSRTPASVFATTNPGRSVNLVTCPSKVFALSFALLGPHGGELTAGPATLIVPAGALASPRVFAISVPRSRYMDVQIAAIGEEHFVFDQPVTIALDYSSCDVDELGEQALTAWFLDTESLQPVAPMLTEDDRVARRAVFVTDHLSRYALAQ